MANRLLPDTALVLSIRFRGQIRLTAAHTAVDLSAFTLSGLRKTDRTAIYAKDTTNLLVVFREAAARAFFKEPLHELFESHIPLDELEGFTGLYRLGEQLEEAADHTERISLVERYLLTRLVHPAPDDLVQAAIQQIHQQQGLVKIGELARSLYISQDALEKRFRRVAGVTPKQFAFLSKMRNVVLRAQQQHAMADIAFDAGYYDLPHFNKDFRLYTGQTPTAFLKMPIIM